MKKQIPLLVLALLTAVMLVSCTAGPNPAVNTAGTEGNIAGFWMGLWHGLISPITLIVSLFSDNVHFYEVHNNGGWYNFGFFLGIGGIGGGSSQSI